MTTFPRAPIAFIDLQAQRRRLGDRIDAAIARVLAHGSFIMGPEVGQLEDQLAAFAGCRYAVTCANGTDALMLVMMAEGIGPGDAVFVPAFTFVATAEPVPQLGATPVFVDVRPDTASLDPVSLESSVEMARDKGLRPRMVVAVDLYGQPADYPAINETAARHGLTVVADAAQSFGASLGGCKVGSLARYTTTSFFPAKPLGCYGDGGAIFTNDSDVAGSLRSLRTHGMGAHKYDNVRLGVNSRLDTLQAAILIEKLSIFADELVQRQRVADRYDAALAKTVTVPMTPGEARSAWAQYVIRVPDRDRFSAELARLDVPTAVHYPSPLHCQPAYQSFPTAPGGLPASERWAAEVLSLPMHPYLDEETQDRIVAAVRTVAASMMVT